MSVEPLGRLQYGDEVDPPDWAALFAALDAIDGLPDERARTRQTSAS